MSKKKILIFLSCLIVNGLFAQTASKNEFLSKDINDSIKFTNTIFKQFTATCDFLDAAVNSLNSFNGLIKKENYRIVL